MPHTTAVGTISGTILSVVAIDAHTFISTILVACLGATASFLFTNLVLKRIYKYFSKKKDNEKN